MKKGMCYWPVWFFCQYSMPVHAEEFVIEDYTFTWHVVKYGGTTMQIQKTPEALVVIFGQPSIPLCALTVSPYRPMQLENS
jgi:hypothetical protein